MIEESKSVMGVQPHTAGPWVSDEAEGEWAIGDADGRVVAYLHQDDIDLIAEREANARLIAAAPELLGFAQPFIRFFEATSSPVSITAALKGVGDDHELTLILTVAQFRAFYEAAEPAVRKATGEGV